MSKLKIVKLTLINWSFHERLSLDIEGTTAVVGDNGTGKSALMDMIQVAYAGGKPAGVRLNPGAQKSQKGGRTIGEYALGAVEARLLRPSAISYICLGFAGDDRLFTIGIAIMATSGAASTSYEIEDRFIAPGVLLNDADFLDGVGAPRPWGAQKPVLEKMCGNHVGPGRKRGLACYPRSSEQYLLDHLSLASGGRFSHDPTELLRAMSNALAFKDQIDSAGTFVRTFLLSADPIDVERIRRSSSNYDQINKDIERLETELALVIRMRETAIAFLDAIENRDLAEAGKSRANTLHALRELNAQRLTLKNKTALLAADVREAEAYAREIKQAQDDVDRLQKLYNLENANSRLGLARSDHNTLLAERTNAENSLKPYEVIRQAAHAIHPIVHAAGIDGAAELKQIIDLPPDPSVDPTIAGLAVLDLTAKLEAIGAGLQTKERELADRASDARREAQEKHRAAEAARVTGRAISESSQNLINELKAKGMNPRLLCSVIDVSDSDWRDAAEARLGRDREAVIVDPQHCREAILYYRDHRRRYQQHSSVVNTAKEAYLNAKADNNSLAKVITTKDPLARAFIDRRLGRIRLAETQSELELPGAAIMKDCTYDDGLVVRTLTVDVLKIGAAGANVAAGLSAAALKAAEIADQAERESKAIRATSANFLTISNILTPGYDVTAFGEQLLELIGRIEESEKSIKTLEQEDNKALAEEVEDAKKALDKRRGDAQELDRRINDTRRDIGDATRIINSPDAGAVGSIAAATAAWSLYRQHRPTVAWYKFRPYFMELAKSSGGNLRQAAERAERRSKENDKIQTDKFLEFQGLLNDHKTSHDGARDFTRNDPIAGKMLPWIEARIAAIENTDLISRRADLVAAADQVRRFLQEDFIHRVSDRAKQVKNTIREINRILKEHELHRETYEFDAVLDPYYEPIVVFAEKANEDDTYIDRVMNGRGHGSEREVFERIKSLVLGQGASGELDAAAKEEEIEKLADYRNWYKFGLDMINVKSGNRTRFDHRMVKGSGGEIQAPFYIIMAVAISAIHHGRARSQVRYDGPVLLDEAFSKLSPANARSCMDFFKQVGLQVLIAAPGGKRAVIDASCDTILDLIRIDDTVYIEHELVGARLREETIAADPESYSIDDLKRFVSQSPRKPANTDSASEGDGQDRSEPADLAAE